MTPDNPTIASHAVYNLVILDESGSMQSIKNTTITGFNEIVQTIKGAKAQYPDQLHFVSLITFNGLGIKTVLYNNPVSSLQLLDQNLYHPDASTPLYDAIGQGVLRLKNDLSTHTDYNVLVTIITDGEENASKEFSRNAINQLISELQATGKWTFTYIGANQDVERVSKQVGIDNYMAFNSNVEETNEMFRKERHSRDLYYKKLSLKQSVREKYFEEEDDDKKTDDENKKV